MVFFRSPKLLLTPVPSGFESPTYVDESGYKIGYKVPIRWVSFSLKNESPINVDFEYSGKGEDKRIDTLKISVTSVFGNLYHATFIPDSKGDIRPYVGHVTKVLGDRKIKLYREREFTRDKPKDFSRMERSLRKVLKSRSFRKEFRNLFKEGKIKNEMFSDDMANYLGLGEGGNTTGKYGKSGKLKEALQN